MTQSWPLRPPFVTTIHDLLGKKPSTVKQHGRLRPGVRTRSAKYPDEYLIQGFRARCQCRGCQRSPSRIHRQKPSATMLTAWCQVSWIVIAVSREKMVLCGAVYANPVPRSRSATESATCKVPGSDWRMMCKEFRQNRVPMPFILDRLRRVVTCPGDDG